MRRKLVLSAALGGGPELVLSRKDSKFRKTRSVRQGSLYSALHRPRQQDGSRATGETSELGRKVEFYSLTGLGRRRLDNERAKWERLSRSIRLYRSRDSA